MRALCKVKTTTYLHFTCALLIRHKGTTFWNWSCPYGLYWHLNDTTALKMKNTVENWNSILSHQVPKVLQFCYSILLVRVVFYVCMKKIKKKLRFSVHWRVKEKLIRLQISYSLAVQKRIDFLLLICNRSGPNCLQEIGTKTLQGFSCIIFRLLDGNVRFLAIYFFAFWLILSNILHLSWAGGYLDTKMKK